MLKNLIHFCYFLFFALLFAILILIAFPLTFLFLLLPKKHTDVAMFRMMKLGGHILFLATGIIPRTYHRRKIDFSKSYIIIPNHQSFLDAATIYTSIPKVFKTLGKKEIEKTPIYGLIYKTVVITVDRSSMTARALSFRKMKKEIEEGLSVIIFPEGTFPDQPQNELMPFQEGGFSLAIIQQADLLPVLYPDSSKRMHPSKIIQMSPGWNRAVFLPPISGAGLQKKDSAVLKKYTQEYMQTCLNFIRENHPHEVWKFALQYLKENPVKTE